MSKTFKEFTTDAYYLEFEKILEEAITEFINENDLTEDQKEFLLSEAKLRGAKRMSPNSPLRGTVSRQDRTRKQKRTRLLRGQAQRLPVWSKYS